MSTLPSGKYQLKTLHEEIALFDRKLAHAQNFESFPNEDERSTAIGKLTSKRSLLIRKAQTMIDEGIEFNALERPKSLRPEGEEAISAEAIVEEPVPVLVAVGAPETETATGPEAIPSPYAGTSLDLQTNLLEYKKRARSKAD